MSALEELPARKRVSLKCAALYTPGASGKQRPNLAIQMRCADIYVFYSVQLHGESLGADKGLECEKKRFLVHPPPNACKDNGPDCEKERFFVHPPPGAYVKTRKKETQLTVM